MKKGIRKNDSTLYERISEDLNTIISPMKRVLVGFTNKPIRGSYSLKYLDTYYTR